MITIEMLRNKINATDAWKDIKEILELETSSEELSRSANDEIILNAFGEGSIKSKALRDIFHRYPFPDIDNLGIYSDYSLEYHVGGGLRTAIALTQKKKNIIILSNCILPF